MECLPEALGSPGATEQLQELCTQALAGSSPWVWQRGHATLSRDLPKFDATCCARCVNVHFSGPASRFLERWGRIPLEAACPKDAGSSGVWASFSPNDSSTFGLQESQSMLLTVSPKVSGVSGPPFPFSVHDAVHLFSLVNDILEDMFLDVSSSSIMECSGIPTPFSRVPVVLPFRVAVLVRMRLPFLVSS